MPPINWSPAISLDPSPSFNTYSSATLAQIADRVVREFSIDHTHLNNHTFQFKQEQSDSTESKNTCDDDEFEFASAFEQRDSSLISADDAFSNGEIRSVFPLFNTDLLLNDMEPKPKPPVRKPLMKFFIEERETPSCSSSEADELEGIQPETYCVWKPRVSESPRRCKKSKSTGTSKRWRFRDLLNRSNSEGEAVEIWKKDDAVKVKEAGAGDLTAAKRKEMKEGERRRFYKRDPVGLFGHMSGMSRNIH